MSRSKRETNPLKPLIDKVPKPMQNKYFLTLVLFIFWFTFISKADIYTQYKLYQTRQKLNYEKQYHQNQIGDLIKQQEILKQDPEKYAREQYYFQKSDEDVFIIENTQ